ncbi:MAG: DNA-binding protein WhiA [Syntrophomonadaceae bacterium]|jgi:DNA-binding protein WhiA
MSFSSDVKNELARLIPERECCRKAEIAAMLAVSGNFVWQGDNLITRAVSESAATARKMFTLIKRVYGLPSAVRMEKRRHFNKNKIYVVDIHFTVADLNILQELALVDDNLQLKRQVAWPLLGKSCCRRAYLRGIFLSRGFINRPSSDYHLELLVNDNRLAADTQKLLARIGLEARISERKNALLLYIKEGEKIVDFLRIVGASKALLDFENIRIIKSMRNNVNRQVNCETANLVKTVDASLRQIETIEKLLARRGVQGLPPGLRELAVLRIENPDSSLKELGLMMDPPLSKSGVAYRMRKLENMAQEVIEDR